MNLLDDIPAGAVIGLDTAPLIYYLEGHPDWGPLVRPLFDTRIIPGTNVAVTATITLAEVLVKPLRSGRADLVASYRTFLTGTPHLSLAAITSGVAEQGADFRARVVRRVVRLAVRRDVLVAVIKCSQLPAAPGSFFETPANSKTLQV